MLSIFLSLHLINLPDRDPDTVVGLNKVVTGWLDLKLGLVGLLDQEGMGHVGYSPKEVETSQAFRSHHQELILVEGHQYNLNEEAS